MQKNEAKPKKHVLKKADDKKKYFHCNIEGHWRKNCPIYLATVKNKKKDEHSKGIFDMLVIKTNLIIFLLLVGFLILVQVLICALLCRILKKLKG